MVTRGSKAIFFAAVAALLYIAVQHAVTSPKAFAGINAQQKKELEVGRSRSLLTRRGIDQALKARIESVKKTARVTDAMRVVAAARVRGAQRQSEQARPFSDELQGMIKGLAKKLAGTGLEAELPMLKVTQDIKSIGLITIGSDKGLCGPFNTFIYRRVASRVQSLNEAGITPKLIVVGKKGPQYVKNKLEGPGLKFEVAKTILFEKGGAKIANAIGEEAKNLFISGEVDKVEMIYAKFVNLLTSKPTVKSLLPLTPQGIEDPEDETFRLTSEDGKLKVEKDKVPAKKAKNIESDLLFDQAPEVILNSMLPLYLNSIILSALYETTASELAGRMTAMKAATDNAKEVGKKLLLLYNRKRQAAITAELCDIVGGCVGLEVTSDGKDIGITENENTVGDEFMEVLEGKSEGVDPFLSGMSNDVQLSTKELDEMLKPGNPSNKALYSFKDVKKPTPRYVQMAEELEKKGQEELAAFEARAK